MSSHLALTRLARTFCWHFFSSSFHLHLIVLSSHHLFMSASKRKREGVDKSPQGVMQYFDTVKVDGNEKGQCALQSRRFDHQSCKTWLNYFKFSSSSQGKAPQRIRPCFVPRGVFRFRSGHAIKEDPPDGRSTNCHQS